MAKRRNPVEEAAENARIAQTAANKYVAAKGYSESSMEAVRRAARANKQNTKVTVGNYQEPPEDRKKK